MAFNKYYFAAAVFLFFTEALIALFVRDSFIRPYGGDFLVVILLYCLLKSFFRIPVKNAIFGVLLFSFFIEGLQYFKLIEILELEENRIVSTVLGNHFEWLDMIIYTFGAVAIFGIEKIISIYFRRKTFHKKSPR